MKKLFNALFSVTTHYLVLIAGKGNGMVGKFFKKKNVISGGFAHTYDEFGNLCEREYWNDERGYWKE